MSTKENAEGGLRSPHANSACATLDLDGRRVHANAQVKFQLSGIRTRQPDTRRRMKREKGRFLAYQVIPRDRRKNRLDIQKRDREVRRHEHGGMQGVMQSDRLIRYLKANTVPPVRLEKSAGHRPCEDINHAER